MRFFFNASIHSIKIKVKQAEAEVVPSSSLVEVDVEFEVKVAVEVEVDATLSFRHSLDGVQILFRWLGGGGWRNGD